MEDGPLTLFPLSQGCGRVSAAAVVSEQAASGCSLTADAARGPACHSGRKASAASDQEPAACWRHRNTSKDPQPEQELKPNLTDRR